MEELATAVGRSPHEVRQTLWVTERHRRSGWLTELPALHAQGAASLGPMEAPADLGAELVGRYGFTRLGAELFEEWLRRLAREVRAVGAGDGELVFFAVGADEGARAKLADARLVPVRLTFFTDDDAELGPRSSVRSRVAEMKFARIHRFARQAREQGALLTLPDLAVLLGIHVDAVRHHVAQHPDVVVPTRGRMPSGNGQHPDLRPRRQRPWGDTIPDARPAPGLDLSRAHRRRQRGPPRPAHTSAAIASLTNFLDTQAGIPPAVQEPLLLELMASAPASSRD